MAATTPSPTITLKDIPKVLHLLTEAEQAKLLEDLERLEQLKNKERAQHSFMAFVNRVWPAFIHGRHHEKMAQAFERVARGR